VQLDESGKVRNLVPYLPQLLTIDRAPMRLDDHFPFDEVFSTSISPLVVHRSSRQIGKTRSIIGRLILECAMIEGRKVLVVVPRQEQSDTLSSTIFKPMIEDSPIRSMLCETNTVGNVRRRSFANGSMVFFTYALADTERTRSKTAHVLFVDEAQDMDSAHLPVLSQTMSACKTPSTWVSGTSKTLDTYLERTWLTSSQGVWQVKCHHCGFDNICCLEPEGHLISMIGEYRDDISEFEPGTVCHRCQKPVRPRLGRWVHRYPERKRDVLGFYAPQIIFPFHYAQPQKWKLFLSYRDGRQGYTTAKFYNECLGEAWDSAYKLVSIDDLKRAATLGPNTIEEARSRGRRYSMVVLGIDWGGGGDEGVSRTKGAAVGLGPDGSAEVFYGFQFEPSTDRVGEAKKIAQIAQTCGAHLIAHDIQGGIGTASESALTYMGWPAERIVPMAYQGVTGGGMVEKRVGTASRQRTYYVMHKAQTLQFLCEAIKQGKVKFFQYDYVDDNQPGLLWDFISLVEDRVDTPTGGTFRIRRSSEHVSDDFTAAVNYAAACLWEYTCRWPSLVNAPTPPDPRY